MLNQCKIDVGERLAALVADDEAFGRFLELHRPSDFCMMAV